MLPWKHKRRTELLSYVTWYEILLETWTDLADTRPIVPSNLIGRDNGTIRDRLNLIGHEYNC